MAEGRGAAGARGTFGPVVALGLAAGILAAVAGARPWVVDPEASGDTTASDPLGLVRAAGEMPLASALSLVVLASWGVVLVTRRRVRRVLTVLGLLASLGLVVTVVTGWVMLPDDVAAVMLEQQPGGGEPDTAVSGWFWGAAAGSLGSVVATALAVRWVPAWPEMGSRYDAPADGGRPAPVDPRPDTDTDTDTRDLDLWKAMDEGRDPTVREDPRTP